MQHFRISIRYGGDVTWSLPFVGTMSDAMRRLRDDVTAVSVGETTLLLFAIDLEHGDRLLVPLERIDSFAILNCDAAGTPLGQRVQESDSGGTS